MSNPRSVAIVGAGIAGATAALGFVDQGFDVTLYSDRDRAGLRDEVPPTGVAILFGASRDWDAQIIPDSYELANTTGISVRLYSEEDGVRSRVLEFNPDFGYEAQAVDVRLRADDRIGHFLDRGGKFVVEAVDAQRLDEIAAAHDLTLVATGKGGLSSFFPVDESRTTYTEPQRRLLQVTLAPKSPLDFEYRNKNSRENLFNLDAQNGEAWFGPFEHKDNGATYSFLGFAKTDGQWAERFASVHDAESARQVVVDLYRDYFPEDAPEIEKLAVIDDPKSWLTGAVTPTVRKAVGRTAGGHPVLAIGDTAIAVDPVAGQGAQNAIIQVAELVAAAAAHQGEFDEEFLTAEFEKHWERRGHASTEVTRLFLGDPEYADHLELSFPAAAVSKPIGSALFGLLSEPTPLLTLRSREDVTGFLAAVGGEPADELLGKFSPSGQFSTAEGARIPA